MRSRTEAKELLTRLYGVEFPDSLFLLHEFLATFRREEWPAYSSALGIEPIGPLHVLSRSDGELQVREPGVPFLMIDRFDADVPEFFSCLKGDRDWLHWGMLLDEPAKGFRGAASYYSNDLENMRVYPSLFAAILNRIEERRTTWEPAGAEERMVHRQTQELLRQFSEKINSFIEAKRVPLDDGRGEGAPSDTGLDLVVPEKGKSWFSRIFNANTRRRHADWSVFPPTGQPHLVHVGKMKKPEEMERLGRLAMIASDQGQVLPVLSLGRSLWFWKDRRDMAHSSHDYGRVAFELLSRAYALLNRPTLLRVLETHFAHRDYDRRET